MNIINGFLKKQVYPVLRAVKVHKVENMANILVIKGI